MLSSPAKAGDPVFQRLLVNHCRLGVLDAPLSRSMTPILRVRRAQSQKLSTSLTPWKPPWATNGRPIASGTAHALPRRTQPAVRLVVDHRPPDAGGHSRADAERHRAVAGGEPAGRGPHRARSFPLLQ